MFSVHDWAEVHRLHDAEGMSKAAIAAKLGMSRTTVHRLLGLNSHLATSGAGPVDQPGRAVLLEASPPAVGAGAGDAHLAGDVGDGAASGDALAQQQPSRWGQAGVSVDHQGPPGSRSRQTAPTSLGGPPSCQQPRGQYS